MSYDSHRNPQNYTGYDMREYSRPDAPIMCKYSDKDEASQKCEWCGDWLCSFCGYTVDDERACNECYEEMRTCEHQCTGNCRRNGCNCKCGEWHKDTANATRLSTSTANDKGAPITNPSQE